MPASLFPRIGRAQILFEADKGNNPQGSTSHEDVDVEPETGERVRPTDVLDRHGRDALRLAEKLADAQNDTYSLREKNRQLRQQLAQAQGRVPADGTVVLSAEDVAAWTAYQALGKADELKQRLAASEGASTELNKLRRDAQIREVAEAAGYKPSVLSDRAQGLELAVREVEEQGKRVKRAVVVKDGKDTPLADYAHEHWTDYLPALQAEAGQGAKPTPSGTPFVRQGGGGRPVSASPVNEYLSKTYRRKQ